MEVIVGVATPLRPAQVQQMLVGTLLFMLQLVSIFFTFSVLFSLKEVEKNPVHRQNVFYLFSIFSQDPHTPEDACIQGTVQF